MFTVTRKVFSSKDVEKMRAAVQEARRPDAWMAGMIRALDPFQHAADLAEEWPQDLGGYPDPADHPHYA